MARANFFVSERWLQLTLKKGEMGNTINAITLTIRARHDIQEHYDCLNGSSQDRIGKHLEGKEARTRLST